VGDPSRTSTWYLPYRLIDGSVDQRRLPKASCAVVINYRGAKVKKIPDAAMPEVFWRLGEAAKEIGKMPQPGKQVPDVYRKLAQILEQPEAQGR
jgi:hypothetical protein